MAGDDRQRTEAPTHRLLVLSLVVLVLAGGVAVDRFRSARGPTVEITRSVRVAGAATSGTSQGSAWFCPLVSDAATGPGIITIAAPGADGTVDGTITLHGPTGVAGRRVVRLDGTAPLVVPVADIMAMAADSVPTMGAVIELDIGGATVEASVPGDGSPSAPCSSTSSSRWWFADGATVTGSRTDLVLFNPFPEDALVDLRFTTESGTARPGGLQGLAIPGGSIRSIPLERFVRRRQHLGTEVVARAGRVVAGERITVRGVGSAVLVGAPQTSRTWFFAEGEVRSGLKERYEIVNPGRVDAVLDVSLLLDAGDAEPFTLTVPAGDRLSFVPSEETRVPVRVSYGVAMVVTEGSPVVVQRTVRATSPAPRRGLASHLGAARTAQRWVLADGGATNALDETISIINPFDRPTTVSVETFSTEGIAGLPIEPMTLVAGGRTTFRLGDHLGAEHASAVITSSDADIVVQRDLVSTVGSSTITVPSPTTSAVAAVADTTLPDITVAATAVRVTTSAPATTRVAAVIAASTVPSAAGPSTSGATPTSPVRVSTTPTSTVPTASAGGRGFSIVRLQTTATVARTLVVPSTTKPSTTTPAASTTVGPSPSASTRVPPAAVTSTGVASTSTTLPSTTALSATATEPSTTTEPPSTTAAAPTTEPPSTTAAAPTTIVPTTTVTTTMPGPSVAIPVNRRPRLGWSSSMGVVAD